MTFKPTLAATHKDISKLHFPLLASQKLDGIRAMVQGGRLLSRTLKPIPNKFIQELYHNAPENLDGELIVGDPCAPDAYRKTVSLVMSDDKPLDWFKGEQIKYYVFDIFSDVRFDERMLVAATLASRTPHCEWVFQHQVKDVAALDAYEAEMLGKGAEGVMLRRYDAPYKQGRSTENEGYLVKVKRFADSEAEITGVFEEMYNANEAFGNELGRTARSTAKAGLVPKGTLGGFEVRDLKTGVDFSIGAGFTAAERKQFWDGALGLLGQVVKYKYFPSGGKDKPRHPIYLGLRSREDM
jgi:DNA ligase-1